MDVDTSRSDAGLGVHLGVFPGDAQGGVAQVIASRLGSLLAAAANVGVGVDVLAAPVGARVGRTREVGRQDLERRLHVGVVDLDEPYESGAEHGVCGVDHLAPQGLDGAEGLLEVVLEVLGDLDNIARQAVEEEVIVVRHAGIVEYGGVLGLARRFENDRLEVLVVEIGF